MKEEETELVGRVEIAEMLGLTRQRVHELSERKDFPARVATVSGTAIWRRREVVAWAKRTGRL